MRPSLAYLALLYFVEYSSLVSAKNHARSLSDAVTLLGHAAYNNNRIRVAAPAVANVASHAAYVRARQASSDSSPTEPDDSSVAAEVAIDSTGLSDDAVKDDVADDSMGDSDVITSSCIQALTSLNGVASNPSGLAICYNVLQFDNTTGNFQSNLGLYQVSQPTGAWVSVNKTTVMVGLGFPGASVASGNNSIAKRDDGLLSLSARASGIFVKRAAPVLLSDMSFVGQVNPSMGSFTNVSMMMIATMPDVILTGNLTDGTSTNTPLSNTEASFVTGVFAGPLPAIAPSMSSTPAPFVLPGVTLGFFPVGLVVTGGWAFLFILAVGLGTVGKINARSTYRRRAKEMCLMDNKLGRP